MYVAEYSPDGGAEHQVYFNTEAEADEFCDYKNPTGEKRKGIGISFLWYSYKFEPEVMTLDEAKDMYSEWDA